MSKILFNDGWRFFKQKIGTNLIDLYKNYTDWYDVEVPHDWLIYNTQNLYETSEGWYKKVFVINNIESKVFRICFDGIYMNSTIYINEKEVGTWHYGYNSFEFDITNFLKEGSNTIFIRVIYESPNSRWYSGAGIIRNVFLKVTPHIYFQSNGLYIATNYQTGNVCISTEINNKNINVLKKIRLNYIIYDKNGKTVYINNIDITADINKVIQDSTLSDSITLKDINIKIDNPVLWDTDNCYIYTLQATLYNDTILLDEENSSFGFRSFRFEPNEGFYLNNKKLKLRGVCLHHDLGALGAAFNITALKRQLLLMKDMGANAIRTSHNMPASEFMDLCDHLGFLVVSEAFDIWEMSKTEFDYARFFRDDWAKDVANWIRRDRNHPSLLMWSIGNEIADTHISTRGLDIARCLQKEVTKYDLNGNGIVTLCTNFIPWENTQLVAEEVITGYNYCDYLYDEHHKRFPNWIIYGSETTSTVKSRGIYHFPADTPNLSHIDLQCSSLDNSSVPWGTKNAELSLIMDRDRNYFAGQFIWTGFDYIGEPTPYTTKNSYFGLVDTAGIPKDIYYLYQSFWTNYKSKPMVHLLPYWDFNPGQIIDVFAYSNAPIVELFLNGVSQGKQVIDHINGKVLHAAWKLPYNPGSLLVKAYNENGDIIACDERKTFGDAYSIVLKTNKPNLLANGVDLIFIEISTIDKEGTHVSNARNRVEVHVEGKGRLVGLDNGDSTDFENFKTNNRKLFSGKLIAIIQSTFKTGTVTISVNSFGLEKASISLQSLPTNINLGVSISESNSYNGVINQKMDTFFHETLIRKIELSIIEGSKNLNKAHPTAKVRAKIFPSYTLYKDITWKVINNSGLDVKNAIIEIDDLDVTVIANYNGDFRLRCMCNNEGAVPQVISELEFSVIGFDFEYKNPYQFNSACYFNLSNIPITVVKDGAVCDFYEKIHIGFQNVDFGLKGSHQIIIYAGNCQFNSTPIEIWENAPNSKNSRLIETIMFESNGEWIEYRPKKFLLSEHLMDVKSIYFVIEKKIIFGGFEFIERPI